MRQLAILIASFLFAAIGALADSLPVVSGAYIFSDFSSPTNPTSTPFTFTGLGQYGYSMTMNASGAVTSVGLLGTGNNQTDVIDNPLTYNSHSGTIDPNESYSSLAARVNSEISKIDDIGYVNENTDAALNVDFTNNAWVMFAAPGTSQTPLLNLLIAEDGGLDPFKLVYCPTSACTTQTVLFDGFNTSAQISLLASGYFQTGDTVKNPSNPADVRKVDQAFLFQFSQPVSGGYFKISETTNYGGEYLELDFGGGAVAGPAPVPEPTSSALIGVFVAALAVMGRQRTGGQLNLDAHR